MSKAESPVLTFPEPIHQRLLEIVLQGKQIEQEKNIILGTYFSTLNIADPQSYDINLEANTITKQEKVASVPVPESKAPKRKRKTVN
tara:strand:- start:12121 stop:12381 length:261 start_codon:yes stop_codon:yes gene_type:complete